MISPRSGSDRIVPICVGQKTHRHKGMGHRYHKVIMTHLALDKSWVSSPGKQKDGNGCSVTSLPALKRPQGSREDTLVRMWGGGKGLHQASQVHVPVSAAPPPNCPPEGDEVRPWCLAGMGLRLHPETLVSNRTGGQSESRHVRNVM